MIDAELRVLEAELGTPRGETVLREPGVGGTCPRCGELHASDAHYCSRCGLDLTTVPSSLQRAAEPARRGGRSGAERSDACADGGGRSDPAEQPRANRSGGGSDARG